MRRRVAYLSLAAAVLIVLLAACSRLNPNGYYVELAPSGGSTFKPNLSVTVGTQVVGDAFTHQENEPDCDELGCTPYTDIDWTQDSSWSSSDKGVARQSPSPYVRGAFDTVAPGVAKICASYSDEAAGLNYYGCATLTVTQN